MGQQIVKQPDGRYAIFSSVVDDFIVIDATPRELIDYWVGCERERLTKKVTETCAALDRGERPYAQFTMNWDEANEHIAEVHSRRREG